MPLAAKSIRAFVGASDFDRSRAFYRDLGFEEAILSDKMSLFRLSNVCFYLQRYYVKDWVDNSMLFFEVTDVDEAFRQVESLGLPEKYPGVRVKPIRDDDWGREFFVHDPSGVLLHFGAFNR